ncbi:MAG: RluA family pseudouridine synthase [Planctomycetota bacterium]
MNADRSNSGTEESRPRRLVVGEADVGRRLDAFLSDQYPSDSRARIQRGISDGLATVDGQQCKPSYKLRLQQAVEFSLPAPAADGPQPEPIPIDVLYEDDDIAVVNKPPGMVVHPSKGHWSGTLASALVHHFEHLSQFGGASRPGIVHRLDRDTSGVMVVAKNDAAHANLADQFQARTVRKEYLAIVSGCPDRDRDQIDFPIGDHPSHRERKALRADHSSSREAQTFYEVEQRFPGLALLRAFPKTGRTHQIRLHFTHIRCPVLCDKLYGGRSRLTAGELRQLVRVKLTAEEHADEHVLLDRQALHAEKLSFAHPVSGTDMQFTAPLTADLDRLLLILQQTRHSI